MSLVVSVGRSPVHAFSKPPTDEILLVAGLGVEGDAHAGATVKHRSRVKRDGPVPNLRQVHLIGTELLDELDLEPGALGENITTRGLDLLALSAGTRLLLGSDAVVELTGLRNPCVQIDRFRKGLMQQVMGHDADGVVVLRGGAMAIVLESGAVRAGADITVEEPAQFVPLHRV